ncbi:MAG: hypothetical protein ACYTG2_15715 [Planctomycetota bacterium]|jgi:hypothetical protein
MTTPAPHPPENDEGPDAAKPARDEQPATGTPPDRKSSPLFKIAPADPKNSFDFEDVADK